jgi:hypothetical protein
LQKKVNTPAAQQKCLKKLMFYHFCVNLPVMMLSYPVFKYMGFTTELPLPSWYALFALEALRHRKASLNESLENPVLVQAGSCS